MDIETGNLRKAILNNFRLSRIILNLGEDSTSSDDTSDSDNELDSDLDEICLDPSSPQSLLMLSMLNAAISCALDLEVIHVYQT